MHICRAILHVPIQQHIHFEFVFIFSFWFLMICDQRNICQNTRCDAVRHSGLRAQRLICHSGFNIVIYGIQQNSYRLFRKHSYIFYILYSCENRVNHRPAFIAHYLFILIVVLMLCYRFFFAQQNVAHLILWIMRSFDNLITKKAKENLLY